MLREPTCFDNKDTKLLDIQRNGFTLKLAKRGNLGVAPHGTVVEVAVVLHHHAGAEDGVLDYHAAIHTSKRKFPSIKKT